MTTQEALAAALQSLDNGERDVPDADALGFAAAILPALSAAGYSIVSTEELEGLRREREVAREWVAAHEYVTDPNSPDTESLERYSAACIEVLAVVSQQWPRAVLEGAKP